MNLTEFLLMRDDYQGRLQYAEAYEQPTTSEAALGALHEARAIERSYTLLDRLSVEAEIIYRRGGGWLTPKQHGQVIRESSLS
jgi:hypothetical protein